MRNQILQRLKSGCWLAGLGLCSMLSLRAHSAPNSTVALDFQRGGVAAELTLPLAELELSFKQPLLATPRDVLADHREALEEYVLAHVKPVAAGGRAWRVAVCGLEVKLEQKPDLIVRLQMTPPAGASARTFNLNYSVINHEVMNHYAVVSVRRDWNNAVFAEKPEVLGNIHFTITSLKIERAAGSWWNGARAVVSHGARQAGGWLWLLALVPGALLVGGWRRRAAPQSRSGHDFRRRTGFARTLEKFAAAAALESRAPIRRLRAFFFVCATISLFTTHSSAQSPTNTAAVVAAANAFLATLSSAQSNSTVYAATLANAGIWSNLPVGGTTRNGLQFSTLTAAQIAAALNVGTNALSNRGATLFEEIRLADAVLGTVNSGMWGYTKYYCAFVGTPSTNAPWMVQVGGHHMAYNVIFNGTYTSATPQFTGTEPNTWTNAGTVYAPLGLQRSNIIALRTTLTTSALLSGSYSDVVFGPNGTGNHDTTFPKAYPTTGRGQLYSTLTAAQQGMVLAYVRAWVTNAQPGVAASLLNDYFTDAALAQTYIGYAGSSTNMTTVGSYFRVDGPRVWIEFIDQGGVAYPAMVHDHGIWRDKLADYGAAFGTNTISTSERPPGITGQPASATNIIGSSATISCTATGTATIYFQWLKDGVAISGATNSSFNIASVVATNAGSYSAKVWNHMGLVTSSSATLTVSAAANTAPSLTAISDRTITPGTSLSITNVVTDSDTPAQTPTFSLLAAPTNATLGSTSGVLAWRPLIAQADTTNAFSVSVTDSGSPNLSATQSFSVVVSPLAAVSNSPPSYSNGVYQMQISGAVGPDYIIQAKTNLNVTNWVSLSTNTPASMPFTWSDSGASNFPARFFRVLLGP